MLQIINPKRHMYSSTPNKIAPEEGDTTVPLKHNTLKEIGPGVNVSDSPLKETSNVLSVTGNHTLLYRFSALKNTSGIHSTPAPLEIITDSTLCCSYIYRNLDQSLCLLFNLVKHPFHILNKAILSCPFHKVLNASRIYDLYLRFIFTF